MTYRACLSSCLLLLTGASQAHDLHQEVHGGRLDIALSCAEDVTVQSYPALHDTVIMDATAQYQEELDQLALFEGPRVRLRLKAADRGAEACWRPQPIGAFQPTLRIKLLVPELFRLGIDASGSGSYHVMVGGSLQLDLDGSSSVDATTVRALNLNLGGSGRVMIGQLTGRAHLDLAGSGDVLVKAVESDEVAIAQSGSASVEVGPGSIAALSIQSSGSGDIAIAATATNAAIEASGSSDVTLTRVTGTLTKEQSGSGAIRVER